MQQVQAVDDLCLMCVVICAADGIIGVNPVRFGGHNTSRFWGGESWGLHETLHPII